MSNPTVLKIVREYLAEHGYDGLYCGGECACLVGDLEPCSKIGADCTAGYRVRCDCGDHDWHVVEEVDDGA